MSQWLFLSPARFKKSPYSIGGRVCNSIAFPVQPSAPACCKNHEPLAMLTAFPVQLCFLLLGLWPDRGDNPDPQVRDLARLRLGCHDTLVVCGISFPALRILPAITFFIIMILFQIDKR